MRGRGVLGPVLYDCLLFLVLARRGKLAVTEAAFLACLVTLMTIYAFRAFVHLPNQGFSRSAAWDVRHWPPQERRRFGEAFMAVCLTTAALVVAAWITGK